MVAIVSAMVFVGAAATSGTVIAGMVAPQWRRILSLATGHVEVGFTPLRTLAIAERRIAVRRWAAAPMPAVPMIAAASRLRAAA